MMRFLAAVLLLGGLLHHPTCARAEDRFFRPPGPGPTGDYRDNPVYAVGDRIELQWETSLQSADLVLWQEQPDGDDARQAYATLAEVNAKTKSLTWTVGYAGFPAYHDPDLSPVYYLELCEAGETGGVRSHYFNMTGARPDSAAAAAAARTTMTSRMSRSRSATVTVSMTTATRNTTTTTMTTMSTTATSRASDPEDEAATASPSPSSSSSPAATAASSADGGGDAQNQKQQQQQPAGMPAGTVAGIAVGAAVVGLALLGAAAWAVRRRAAWLRRRWGGRSGRAGGGCGMGGCGIGS
ncbi:hypothetical protein LZ30DRAFT_349890 [Colletotrichum cereale]|nr:hypothetical protein LZ30DRAFT_349890 [Colletotrichum cereale]